MTVLLLCHHWLLFVGLVLFESEAYDSSRDMETRYIGQDMRFYPYQTRDIPTHNSEPLDT